MGDEGPSGSGLEDVDLATQRHNCPAADSHRLENEAPPPHPGSSDALRNAVSDHGGAEELSLEDKKREVDYSIE